MSDTTDKSQANAGQEATHTPGPWRLGWRYNSIVADHPTGHDDTISCKEYRGHMVCESVKWDANALLIAAAPDMLETLRNIKRFSNCSGAREMARVAIAKAEGKT